MRIVNRQSMYGSSNSSGGAGKPDTSTKIPRGLRALPIASTTTATSTRSEMAELKQEARSIEEWWASPRWKHTTRTYSGKQQMKGNEILLFLYIHSHSYSSPHDKQQWTWPASVRPLPLAEVPPRRLPTPRLATVSRRSSGLCSPSSIQSVVIPTRLVLWIPFRRSKWRLISALSTSVAGSALRPPPRPTSLVQTLLIIP